MGTKNNPGKFDCYEAADPNEPMFVLLARDPDAPALVRQWAVWRANREGTMDTPKIQEALACADSMNDWQKEHE